MVHGGAGEISDERVKPKVFMQIIYSASNTSSALLEMEILASEKLSVRSFLPCVWPCGEECRF